MASGDRDKVASSVSMLGTFQAGGDAIPREYHRRVLKKIAQLTKVIYALNTKNDENEQFIAHLKATHADDLVKILSDSTCKLQQCEEKLYLDKEASETKVVELRASLMTAQEERNQLLQEQETYRKTVEDKVETLKARHSDSLLFLSKQLESLRSDQAQQLKELGQFRAELSKKSGKQIEENKSRHQKEMEDLRECLKREFSQVRSSLEEKHKEEVAFMRAKFEEKIRNHQLAAAKVSEETAAAERRAWEGRENTMKYEFSQREEQLNHQLSTLSNDLRVARDSLALSEKKAADLLSEFEDSKTGSADVRGQLREAESEVESLKIALRETKIELEISKEHYQQQSAEMKGMAGDIGRLEALCLSSEGVVGELQGRVTSLQERIKLLEGERKALETSQNESNQANETNVAQIRALEKDLEKMRREKQEMRVQFAREIEAAQSQLGKKEIELGHQQLEALQQLREENKRAALDAVKDQEAALEELEKRLQSEREEEVQQLKERLEGENTRLREYLSDKTSELELAQAELKRLENELSKREKGLGSAADSLERLREELKSVRGDLMAARREKQERTKERDKLLSSVEVLKGKVRELTRMHQDQVVKLKKELTEEVENKWKEKLMLECAALRQELLSRHKEDCKASLSELAELKEKAMGKARRRWQEEREGLLKQVSELEKRLQEMQSSNSALLDRVRASSESQIATLKVELQEQRKRHSAFLEEQEQSHSKELAALGRRLANEREELAASLGEKYQKEKESMHLANQMAVETLRRSLQLHGQQQMEQLEQQHTRRMANLQVDLTAEHEREKKDLRVECELEIHRHRDQTEKLLAERRKEVKQYERTVSSLNIDIEHRDAELSKLRDKVNSLTVAVNNLRKELEVKGQEVLGVRRETNSLLQQRTRELSAAHSVEMESLSMQHKHHSQMLLSEFNNAKTLFTNKISELETKVRDWERRYRSRESKPEDLELIKELQLVKEQLKQRIKDLIAEKRVYQLELMNREKNYNQVFNANPLVGVLNPLAGKKKPNSIFGSRYPSAPSLMSPSLEPHPPLLEPHPPSTLASLSGPLIPHHTVTTTTSAGQLLSRRDHQQPAKAKKFMALKDSPLSKHKFPDATANAEDGPIKPPAPTNTPLTTTVQ